MAQIPPNLDEWQITDISGEVCLIHLPGLDEEEVLLRANPSYRNNFMESLDRISTIDLLNPRQKQWVHFWMGYFYAHMTRSV